MLYWQTKDEWAELGEWYEDPLSSSGWSTWKTAEFVSARILLSQYRGMWKM